MRKLKFRVWDTDKVTINKILIAIPVIIFLVLLVFMLIFTTNTELKCNFYYDDDSNSWLFEKNNTEVNNFIEECESRFGIGNKKDYSEELKGGEFE